MVQTIGLVIVALCLLGAVVIVNRGKQRLFVRMGAQAVLFLVLMELILRGSGWMARRNLVPLEPPPLPEEAFFGNPGYQFYGEGMNGDSYPVGGRTMTRVEDELRIVGFGDSFARGSGADYAQSLLPRVAAFLKDSGGREVQVYNVAEEGTDYWEMDCRYWDSVRILSPDIVLWVFVLNDLSAPGSIFHEMNDLINDVYGREVETTGLLLVDIPSRLLAQRRITRASILGYQAAYDRNVNEIELEIFEKRIGRIIRDTTSRGGRFVFVLFPLLYSLEDYPFVASHEELRRIVERQGGEVIDLLPTFRGWNAAELWASPTDYHPNDYGHWLAAQAVIEELKDGEPPLSQSTDCSLLTAESPTDADRRAAFDAETASVRQTRCESPLDPSRALDLAEKQLGMLEAQIEEYGMDSSVPACLTFRQFKFNVLAVGGMLQDRNDPQAEAIRERARSLIDRHRTLLPISE